MRLIIMVVFLLALTASGFRFSTSNLKQAGIAESIKRGGVVYSQYCLPCHQANGAGVPNLNPPLIKTSWVLGDKAKLATVVLQGLSGEIEIGDEVYNNTMPPHNFLTDFQIADVLTYVRNNFGNKAAQIKPAEVKAVRAKLSPNIPK